MIYVFGSINIDLVTRVARIPAPGETVIGPSYEVIAGGKGANQALAARRAGASVAMIGAVGQDGYCDTAMANLKADGVDILSIAQVVQPTGAAFIVIDAQGQNAITVAAGANGSARAAQLAGLPLTSADTLLLQREVPDAQCESAARHARHCGARIVLNLAPGGGISSDYLGLLDILVMNEHEAAILGHSMGLVAPDFADVARQAAACGCQAVVITLGAAGLVAWHHGEMFQLPAHQVAVVDTTAAGDAFVGAFAAMMDSGAAFATALQFGLAAGSLACTQQGAQPSLPKREEINALANI